VIDSIVSDLLEAAKRRKVRNRIREYDATFKREASGYPSHVLLGYAGIQELSWELLYVRIENAEPEVTSNQKDPRVCCREYLESSDEGIPHALSSSRSAFVNSSPRAVR